MRRRKRKLGRRPRRPSSLVPNPLQWGIIGLTGAAASRTLRDEADLLPFQATKLYLNSCPPAIAAPKKCSSKRVFPAREEASAQWQPWLRPPVAEAGQARSAITARTREVGVASETSPKGVR